MTITPTLRASARSAYRDLWRASSLTFSGDERVLKAFRFKMREDMLNGRLQKDPTVFDEQIRHAREVAQVLRRNVVQAVPDAQRELWRLRITDDTELGDNSTVKNPPQSISTRQARKEEKAVQGDTDAVPHSDSSSLPQFYSARKKAHKQRALPELKEEDLEESFVRGSGPGGQSINKTRNNVQLLHKPTGIRVTCQETRSLSQNRSIARRLLLQRLDKIQNPGLSKEEMKRARQIERERRRRKKRKKKEQAIQDSESFLVGE